jgi:predicted ABC-type sugar transport system permease subunit
LKILSVIAIVIPVASARLIRSARFGQHARSRFASSDAARRSGIVPGAI